MKIDNVGNTLYFTSASQSLYQCSILNLTCTAPNAPVQIIPSLIYTSSAVVGLGIASMLTNSATPLSGGI